jgi:hypothetical protein
MLGMAKRKGGGRYRRFRARILARDVGCTEPACPNRSTQLHHDPALVEGGQELNPNHARGVCGPCHRRLSAELRERLGLPYSPGSKPPARRVDKAGPPKVWLGEAFADYEVEGPAQVIMHTGETRYVPAGRRG